MPEPIVLDTNLVVSAIILPSSLAAQALDVALQTRDVVVSTATIAELGDVLGRPKFDRYVAPADRQRLLHRYVAATRAVAVEHEVHDCADARDNKFLALALSARATLLVTGDKRDLLCMHPWRNIAILSLRQFVDSHGPMAGS
ncbi:putative toxin-antitoxin system toxin component, PIN family [Ottowia testudinis]|uniref:Toxin-antitoxin system toxin component, PIN family n=1 Tax=Ottowia testudinis TaxID=2816950 RepID=A0A975H4Z4_9BURK|nr:putative toxin-antitoxin system toxin component, PIN family [Ottowia testudinis]QTD46831.1 putative toxin-antitoxin system toxin component, PIN family [Ottowia testudinis]